MIVVPMVACVSVCLSRRVLFYVSVASVLAWITIAIRHRYYLHLHHWFLGILLMPITHTLSPLLSLAAIGFCAAQFVEGAAKWYVRCRVAHAVSTLLCGRSGVMAVSAGVCFAAGRVRQSGTRES